MSNQYLSLRLKTTTQATRMRRPISTVAPTELIEPTAYLEGNELVTLTGIAMNFQDARTWDAYVERLARVPVSGILFNSGIAHPEVPGGLVDAGNRFDVPVLEVSPPVNLLQVHRLVNDTIQAEHYAVLRSSLELADACAELEARGTTLLELLERIRVVVGGEVGLIDSQGRMVASRPAGMHWQLPDAHTRRSSGEVSEHVRRLNPVRGGERFSIAVRSPQSESVLDPLLGPVGSIVSLHLNSAADYYNEENDRMRSMIERLRLPDADSPRYTKKLMRAAGFDPQKPTILITVRAGADPNDAWRMRIQFADLFPTLGLLETEHYSLLIGQNFNPDAAQTSVIQRLHKIAPRRPAIVTAPLLSTGSLRTAILASPRQLDRVNEPTAARHFDLPSVLATSLTKGGIEQALQFIRPLKTCDDDTNSDFITTLRAFLDADGSPTKTAAALFIHRNSLTYRLNRIGELLGVSLSTVDGKSTCAVALAVWEMQEEARLR
ncbi:helix-turn-helix domain-containing protein [Rhodococcus sp. IEGM 1366]|uniref:helix-turn-helix domain-containing protein n=1 Tax=Rhodococcus sp. IEGM 1366 TaxID=3082223 RepID=UPI00295498C0|nr:helix-turn-helix domain-containing protein [Rhodococcus sp. IEGM 1366]MDV8070738.1 helix-turn-helix domain-containing protein [Rhodococcus sp. IEGM 1366]